MTAVHIGRPAADGAPEWAEVGTLGDNGLTLAPQEPADVAALASGAVVATFELAAADVSRDALDVLTAAPRPGHAPPAYAVTVTYAAAPEWVAVPPRKRRGLTGKAYRAARRRHGRRVRAWRRAGSPRDLRTAHMPYGAVTAEPVPGMPGCMSVQVAPAF